MSVALTIFTPAYNRAHTLGRLYESLKKQTLKNFEWLIVDDGSTDHTEIVVKEFIQDSIINIRYLKQENAGKQAAWNKAVLNANGFLFCGVDSDDALAKETNIEEIFQKYISLLNSDSIIGLRFLAYSNVKKKFDGKKISENIVISSYFEEFSNAKNFGERIDVFKTDILKCFLYPVASNIKFIPEIWFYVQISHAGYKFAYIPEPLRLFFDDATENRLSKSSLLKHAEGHYISRATMLKLIPIYVYFGNVMAWVKTIIRFGQCAHYLNKSFMQRKQDTNIIYAIFSYFSRFIKVGI
ncbi:glycosyl transferase family 2 [Acinetobacter baumannii]|uniref:glycosyltransferase family 2 protein n=1 Tax=Acinetobacter genomosp. 33YU TaxID=1675530 RepID=UPI00057373C8|nr:glycosyltransferase family 2 protein [Acinetobacter genomosp. 33YU]KHO14248.1 glycosyl transferase family 2 [Acinetobacter baumannii]ONN48112.1 glycosyl transferase family 2 [Acinetobacter genomosp. 33YU]